MGTFGPKGFTAGAPTKTVLIPETMTDQASKFVGSQTYSLPFYSCSVSAGFPSPADDHLDGELNLNEFLIHHPAATFFVRASGSSMLGAGIHDGDVLIVDRSLEPRDGKIIIAAVNGELTVKRLKRQGSKVYLEPENAAYPAIELSEDDEMHCWGVVTNVIHPV